MRPVVLGLVVATLACARGEVPRGLPCGGARQLTGNGIGAFRIGTPIDSLRTRCEVVADAVDPNGMEGMPERRVTVRIDSIDVSALAVGGAVQRIDVESPVLRTASGLGVGTTLGELRSLQVEIFTGEGNVAAVIAKACGLSFLLAARPSASPADLPDSVRVRKVLIIGCDPLTSAPR